ncbi:FtsX-like permease family protein [candidate division KSB1 bacterium]|nr:FtsX-like permease family protein [candidate division KSB1 bacterium]NIR72498.1 FtsX-like permease family protein [candidate division KSB1 bacterium]NIS28153.1 FtsX-like permease family protein [candidate division KSB1 bacterium]NIT75047.1 FtsX-like permease family protein [candidate division KSB1 bacterium]NIU28833.1 FtsX-like permease family protein [candidate division KSB1 bacterium]
MIYFKITFRNLIKSKSYTFINVTGLALGITCALVIFLIIRFEYSFDNYHEDDERIFRVVAESREFGETSHTAGVPFPLPEAMRTDFPEIEHLTIVDSNFGDPVISVQQLDGSFRRFREKERGVAFVEPDYFDIFTYRWLQGNPVTALANPSSAVISEGLAHKYFGETDPMGKQLNFNNWLDVQVTGIVEDVPKNTDLPFDMLIRFDPEQRGNDNWGSVSSAVQCYIKLPPRVSPMAIESRFDAFIEKHHNEEAAETMTLSLQPLRDIHFDERFSNFNWRDVAPETLLALGLIGIFLLVTACINFVNLNTALAVRRSKEVGVRKVLGSGRFQLVMHFLGETAAITLCAILISIAAAEVALNFLNSLLGYELSLNLFADTTLLLFLSAVFVVVVIAAGFYPSLYLSGFNPIEAVRNTIHVSYKEGLPLRKGLVVLQFAISQALIIAAIVISSQIKYVRSADMGFNKDAIVEVGLPSGKTQYVTRLKTELMQHPGIRSVCYSNTGTASSNVWGGDYELQDGDLLKEGNAQVKFVDDDFMKTYGVDLLAGETLTPTDTLRKFLVNESFTKDVGFGNDFHSLLGKEVEIWGRKAPIAGVVGDFNTTSLHQEIAPVIMIMQNRYMMAGIKIDMRRVSEVLPFIEETWTSVYDKSVFSYEFLDEAIANFYKEEQKMAGLVNIFTMIAILIGCMGLVGLVSYMATQRTKEIGIRKVLGASFANILSLLSKEVTVLILIAFLMAAPVAYYFMQSWLEDFAYRIDLRMGMFLMALAASFLIAFVTVGYKSVRAAATNPVESLRYE